MAFSVPSLLLSSQSAYRKVFATHICIKWAQRHINPAVLLCTYIRIQNSMLRILEIAQKLATYFIKIKVRRL